MSYDSSISIHWDDNGGGTPLAPERAGLTRALSEVLAEAGKDLRSVGEQWVAAGSITDDGAQVFVSLASDAWESTRGAGVASDSSPRVEAVALLQDLVIEHTWSARPVCPLPGHHHPLKVVEVQAQLLWRCPTSDWQCRVGSYDLPQDAVR